MDIFEERNKDDAKLPSTGFINFVFSLNMVGKCIFSALLNTFETDTVFDT